MGEDIMIVGVDPASPDGDSTVIYFVGTGQVITFDGLALPDIRDSGTVTVGTHDDFGLTYFFENDRPQVQEIVEPPPRPWDAPRQDWLKGRKRRQRR